MVLLSCSGTGGIYAKLANGVAQYNSAQFSPPTILWRCNLFCVVNKRIIAREAKVQANAGRHSRCCRDKVALLAMLYSF